MEGHSKPVSEALKKIDSEVLTFGGRFRLSPRETEILSLLVQRIISIKQIADHLKLSPSTVNNHLNSIFEKTQTSSKSELLAILFSGVLAKLNDYKLFHRKPKALVLDDEPDIAETLTEQLQDYGISADCATDPRVAFDMLKKRAYDFLVTDMRMPHMTGADLLNELRKNHLTWPAVVFYSGYSQYKPEDILDMGGIAYFDKPVDAKAMAEVLFEFYLDKELSHDDVASEGVPLHKELVATQRYVGSGGCFLHIQNPEVIQSPDFRPGQLIRFEVRDESSKLSIMAQGRVVWRRGEVTGNLLPGLGVKFVGLDEQSRKNVETISAKSHSVAFIPKGAVN